MIGYMVHRGLLDMKAVDDLVGGTILGFWSRVKDWAEERRKRTGHYEFLEWCQWIAIQLERRRADHPYVPAYRGYLD